MPMYDFQCGTCGQVEERYSVCQEPIPQPCSNCGGATSWLPSFWYTSAREAQAFEPIVVHKNAAGEIHFPGQTDAKPRPGYTKVELRTAAEVRALEREVNAREGAKAQAYAQARTQDLGRQVAGMREVFSKQLSQMSPRGREFYARIREEADRQRAKGYKAHSPDFHVEAFSQNASNREHGYDREGNRRRK